MKQELFIHGYGVFIGYSNGSIVVRRKELASEQFTVRSILHIILQGEGVSISNDALIACADKGIPVFIFDGIGRVRAFVNNGMAQKNHQWEELQHAFVQSTRATRFVMHCLQLKEQRQRATAHYHWRSLRRTENRFKQSHNNPLKLGVAPPSDYAQFENSQLGQARDRIFLQEARSARLYWQDVQRLMPDVLQFHGRVKRHAQDSLNMLLNYGYALLSGAVLRQILFAGLDPSVGLLHHRRGTAYPLVYDLMEPFRPLIDHAVFAFVHRQHRLLQDRHGALRVSVIKRFRRHYNRVMIRPEPWSRRKKSLEVLVKDMVAAFKMQISAT